MTASQTETETLAHRDVELVAPVQVAPVQSGPVEATPLRRRWSRRIAADLIGLGDILAVLAGFMLPAIIYNQAGGMITDWRLLAQAGMAAAVIVHMVLRLNGMYATEKMHDIPLDPGKIFLVVVLAMVGLMGLGVPHAIRDGHQWIWFSVALSACYTFLILNRAIAHPILTHMTRKGHFDERIAVFGAGQIARRVKEHLSKPEQGIHFAGVYDDRMGDDRLNPEGLEVAGRLDDLIAKARNSEIDRIIIALPQTADQRIANVARKLEALPVSLHIVTHIASDLVEDGPAHKVSAVGSVGLLDVKKKPLNDWAPVLKRGEDLVIGSLLLVAAIPLVPLIALAIKLDSAGPVMFRQRRSGLNLEPIEILKFRTMSVRAPGDEAAQATPGDSRVTRVGRILRRTSLDELPQILNVLRGEMSLVGPRPHLFEHDAQFGEMIEMYGHRHQVKPGLTGLAQVRGHRGETRTTGHVEARVNSDLQYIRNWSLGLDLQILLRTVWAVITGRNAH